MSKNTGSKLSKYHETTVNLSNYQKEALRTAFYPNFGNNISYPIIALFEECGELVEKLDDQADHKEIVKELGDVLWYSAMVYYELEEDFSFKLEKTYMTPIMLMKKAARIAGIIKKSQRDQEGELTKEKRKELLSYLDFILSFIHNIAFQVDYSIQEVCDLNIKKIDDRLARDKLSGEGDNR